ncbi:MAG: hypothetical protein ACKPFK_30350 [Dolichospermum sp.]
MERWGTYSFIAIVIIASLANKNRKAIAPHIPKQRSHLHIPNSDRSHISKSDRVYSQTWNGNEEVAITTI